MENKLILVNRKDLSLTGVKKVVQATESVIELTLEDCNLILQGKNLHINKLDISSQIAGIDGIIDSIKFTNKAMKENIFKKVFK